ncbi:MAG TPA: hypothetical protein PLE19_19455 [Planctomycetota bacterium]|nr:hypothetical protein [Planctomycetota bacterium]
MTPQELGHDAWTRRVGDTIPFTQLPALIGAVQAEREKSRPDVSPGDLAKALVDTCVFACPRCGVFDNKAVLAAATAAQMMAEDPQMAVSFGGPDIAALASGKCPGCGGTTVQMVLDLGLLRRDTYWSEKAKAALGCVAGLLIASFTGLMVGAVLGSADATPASRVAVPIVGLFFLFFAIACGAGVPGAFRRYGRRRVFLAYVCLVVVVSLAVFALRFGAGNGAASAGPPAASAERR